MDDIKVCKPEHMSDDYILDIAAETAKNLAGTAHDEETQLHAVELLLEIAKFRSALRMNAAMMQQSGMFEDDGR